MIVLLFLEANGTVVLVFSVCPLVDEDKRLVPGWEGLAVWKTEFCSGGLLLLLLSHFSRVHLCATP